MKRFFSITLLALCMPLLGHANAEQPVKEAQCLSGDVEVSGHTVLAASCRHTAALTIRTSGTVLDCQGSTVDGEGKRPVGIAIESDGKPLKGVVVRNCLVINAKYHGINIGWSLADRAKSERHARDVLYTLTPAGTLIENVTIRNAGRTGLYVDDYVTDTIVDGTTISDSGGVGIYLEHSSRGSTIRNSRIIGNGFVLRREGIAIDSSSGNTVQNSVIAGNAIGGIFLYRNCSEHLEQDAKQVQRWQSTDHNLVENNRIAGGKAGVWIASRQSMDTSMMACGNGYYADGKYTLDSARHNRVSNNEIADAEYGVLIEDDDNTVASNRFVGIRKVAIQVGSGPRYLYLHKPVVATRIQKNVFIGPGETTKFVSGSENPAGTTRVD
ncbi:right-handed parallel beta-helix repeat-containing protein [Janthinobacterium sp. 17J80-10]|uniref:right-handed parallel beta-helix repeat-containing protein n=1 Tax=Janthinobacterium sp. 17J80-10 TaxID=2497863 RepID=UPI0010053114|nr:right-handed parallel beta-helix repeat-containing protein [Janthinobacterium sp. 17J80-10]QAU35548.1 right-handed parallel beta-helix repeat-containing protein [Janthinobacterium sp. 17J80-10]